MYVRPYIDYLIQFHRERDYFECHEILEEYWKKDNSSERQVWVILIQYAVALYHHRIRNFKGASKMIRSAHEKLQRNDHILFILGIDSTQLKKDFIQLETRILEKKQYESPNLPFQDKGLEEYLLLLSDQDNLSFFQKSPMEKDELIFKHTLRDRSAIILERELARIQRKGHK